MVESIKSKILNELDVYIYKAFVNRKGSSLKSNVPNIKKPKSTSLATDIASLKFKLAEKNV